MKSDQAIRIAIVDDHQLVRQGLRQTLEEAQGFTVIAEGASADDAIQIARTTSLDVLLVDVNMPGGGLRAAAEVCREKLVPKVLLLTVYDGGTEAAKEAGAAGYILKGISGDELIAIIRNVHTGQHHFSTVSPDPYSRTS